MPQIELVPRIEIWTVRWPIQWLLKYGVSADSSIVTVGWGNVLLEGEEVTDDVSKEVSLIGN